MVQQCFLSLKSSKNYPKRFSRFINCQIMIQTMEHQTLLNLSNEADYSKFVTRKRNIQRYIKRKKIHKIHLRNLLS